jgi:hypothetical protein
MAAMQVDSVVLWEAGISGVAVRGSTGAYTYTDGNYTMSAGTASACTGLTPPIDLVTTTAIRFNTGVTALPGTPVFLYKRVTYEFKNSVSMPGRKALWRAVVSNAVDEELIAPFDTSAGFRFYTDASSAPQVAVPSPLKSITGLELQLVGINERVATSSAQERVPYMTSVFFKNR